MLINHSSHQHVIIFILYYFINNDNNNSHKYFYLNRKGRALNTEFSLEECPSVNMEDTVHDAGDDTDQEQHEEDLSEPEQEEESTPPPQKKRRSHPNNAGMTVEVEKDIIGKPASIAYHHCLKQLCDHVTVPVDMCQAKDPSTNKPCQARGPFEIHVKSRVTAAIIEWVSLVFSTRGNIFFNLVIGLSSPSY